MITMTGILEQTTLAYRVDALLRIHPHILLTTCIHGERDGSMMTEPSRSITARGHNIMRGIPVTPDTLRQTVADFYNTTIDPQDYLAIIPCFPLAVIKRYAADLAKHRILVLGDWEGVTTFHLAQIYQKKQIDPRRFVKHAALSLYLTDEEHEYEMDEIIHQHRLERVSREQRIQRARKGGLSTLSRYGKEHMREIGKRGGQTTLARYGKEHMRAIGKHGYQNFSKIYERQPIHTSGWAIVRRSDQKIIATY